MDKKYLSKRREAIYEATDKLGVLIDVLREDNKSAEIRVLIEEIRKLKLKLIPMAD